MARSLDEVCRQFQAYGLPQLAAHEVKVGKDQWTRYGPRKKAFYKIKEYVSGKTGKTFYVGCFGMGGDDIRRIEADFSDEDPAEVARWRREQEEIQKRELAKRAEAARLAGVRAQQQWRASADKGEAAYLVKKRIEPEGVRFADNGDVLVPLYRYDAQPPRMVGLQKIQPDGEKRFNRGFDPVGAACLLGLDLVTTVQDRILIAEGYATAVSVLMAIERRWPVCMALFADNLLAVGRILRALYPDAELVFCADDDYLTGEAGRLKAEAAAAQLGKARVLVPRFTVARAASKQDEALPRLTDYNDLHVAEGLEAVRQQLLPALLGVAEGAPADDGANAEPDCAGAEMLLVGPPASSANTAEGGRGDEGDQGLYLFKHVALIAGKTRVWDGVKQVEMSTTAAKALYGKQAVDEWMARTDKRVMSVRDVAALRDAVSTHERRRDDRYTEILKRYVHLDGSDSIFDRDLHEMISQSALKLAVGDWFIEWVNDPFRESIRFRNVVFDPTQRANPETHINLFRGLPGKPLHDHSKCAAILDLLAHLVNGDADAFHWLACWLAYPLQHVGGKLATAVLMHGDVHGTGKSLFFEGCYKPAYGEYATTLGQHQLESQYTAWRSRKLFCLFEEVLSNHQKYSHTGTLKHMISGRTQNIEKKFVDAWEEANHMNAVFLSNALQPFHVEASDRRFLVVWPENKLPEADQKAVERELNNGGAAAFHGWLLDYDVGDFGPHTKPPMTAAKQRLIDYGLSTWEVFFNEWKGGYLQVPFSACLSEDLFGLYTQWCERGREGKPLSKHKFCNVMSTRVRKSVKHFRTTVNNGQRHFFVCETPPRDRPEQDWLGEQMLRFKDAARQAGWDPEKW